MFNVQSFKLFTYLDFCFTKAISLIVPILNQVVEFEIISNFF